MAKVYNQKELKIFLKSLFEMDGISNGKIRKLTKIIHNVYCENLTVDIPDLANFCSNFVQVEILLENSTFELNYLRLLGNDAYCSMWLNKEGLWFENHYEEKIKLVDLMR